MIKIGAKQKFNLFLDFFYSQKAQSAISLLAHVPIGWKNVVELFQIIDNHMDNNWFCDR
jgi:hypothetical protein